MGKQIDILRKLIREELRAVIKEELPRLLEENKKSVPSYKESVLESKNKKIPGTLNTSRPAPPKFVSRDPISNILNETANSMMQSEDTFYFDSSNVTADGLGMMQNVNYNREPNVVDNVSDMLSSARPSSNIEMVQINNVPDFTDLMSRMREKGVM
jgi:hypothetical protein